MTGDLAFEEFEKKTPRIGLLYIYTYSVMRQNILTFIERTKKKHKYEVIFIFKKL